MNFIYRNVYLFHFCIILTSCDNSNFNNPYPSSEAKSNIFYSSFSEQPKTLDPAQSYSNNEFAFIAQIYEPPLQYHYLKRPLTLVPLTSDGFPEITYYDYNDKVIKNLNNKSKVKQTVYRIKIKPDIYYQPHPAFAINAGKYIYHNLKLSDFDKLNIKNLSDFKQIGTRELVAEDYIFQIKRLAHPNIHSPIYGLLSKHIQGFSQFSNELTNLVLNRQSKGVFADLKERTIKGVRSIDRYTFEIVINKQYPQFIYWLAMPFFAPIPWEGEVFYAQTGMNENNITFDWYPIGTGPYFLSVNNPNREMILTKNPNYHGEKYPFQGEKEDLKDGLLEEANLPLPFVNKAVYMLEKESIPRWNKFLQGYYDQSAISSDSFTEAVYLDDRGIPQLTAEMKKKGIYLETAISPSIFYMGFNMLDPIVGGTSERAKLLRQAISIAINMEEFISIFLNGRGVSAHSPIPPGIGNIGPKYNNYVYNVSNEYLGVKRKSIDEAKQLLLKAGYPNGIDPKSNKPIMIKYDIASNGSSGGRAQFDWLRKQFNKIGLELDIRETMYNRFQEKIRNGDTQIFYWGWNADYPDPENFMFLLYGPNGKVKFGGENASNYKNPEYDKLYDQLQLTVSEQEKNVLLTKMINIIQKDAVWIWGFHPIDFVLSHQWKKKSKLNEIANHTLKYQKIDPDIRYKKRLEWNHPHWTPLVILLLLGILLLIPVFITYYKMQYRPRYKCK